MKQRRHWVFPLAAALLVGPAHQAAWAQGQGSAHSSLMARLRSFLGLQPRLVSVGGTRSKTSLSVCLLSPGPIQSDRDGPTVRVVDPLPVLVVGSPLNEIELRRGEVVLWSRLASSKAPISGRLSWPLPPIKPGEQLDLAMRPRGAAGGDWAVVMLETASLAAQQRYAAALQISVGDEKQRLQQLDQAAAAGDGALAQALLWAPISASNSALGTLQQEQQSSCQITPTTR